MKATKLLILIFLIAGLLLAETAQAGGRYQRDMVFRYWSDTLRPPASVDWIYLPNGGVRYNQLFYQRAASFISRFEGFHSCVYADPAGHATIGYGHLIHYGPPTAETLAQWPCMSKAQGRALLMKDIKRKINPESALIDLTAYSFKHNGFNINQAVALASFMFNLGPNILDDTKLHEYLIGSPVKYQPRMYRLAARQMLRFDKATDASGNVISLPGLTRRRQAEARLFLKDPWICRLEGRGTVLTRVCYRWK